LGEAKDNYGFCFEIERNVVKVRNKESEKLFEAAIKSRFENAFTSANKKNAGGFLITPGKLEKMYPL